MYSHIFKYQGAFLLILTKGAEINQGVISQSVCPDRKTAKQMAKQLGATPWNY